MALNIQDLTVTCRQFGPGERIPEIHSADGGNVAPVLDITGIPDGTVELALICHDPDAPLPRGFTHWVVYGINPATPTVGDTASYREGPNTLGQASYSGPQPPAGHGVHHYYFWAYALDTAVDGSPAREVFLDRYAGHIIEQNRVVGTFSR